MSGVPYRLRVKKGSVELEASAPSPEEAFELMNKLLDFADKVAEKGPEVAAAPGGPASLLAQPRSPKIGFPTKPSSIEEFPKTATGRVRYLLSTGFFSKERSLSETVEALAREGFPYNTKPVDKALRMLIRKGDMRRVGTRRHYRYVER